MKNILLLTILSILPVFGISQNLKELKKICEEQNTAKSWNDLAEYYRNEQDTLNLMKSIRKAYYLANKSGNDQEIGRAFMYEGDYQYQKKLKIDSVYLNMKLKAIEYLVKCNSTPYLTEAYYDLSRFYNVIGKYDIAVRYLKLSLKTQIEEDTRGDAPIYCDIAYSYLYKGMLDSVEHYAQTAINIAKIKNDTISMYTGYSYLGIVSSKRNNFTEAIEYYTNISNICTQQQNWKYLITVLCNIATLYHGYDKYDKAIEIGEKALYIVNEHNLSTSQRARPLLTLAISLCLTKQYHKAIEYYKQALLVVEEQDFIRACLTGLGESYHYLNIPDSSNYYFDKLEDLYIKNNGGKGASYYNLKGRRAFFISNYKEAIFYWEKTIANRGKPLGLGSNLRETSSFYLNLSTAYEKGLKDYKKALYYKDKALILQDSIFQNKHNNALSEFYAQYRTAEKDLKISQLNEEKQKALFQRTLIISIAVFVTVMLFIAFLYNRIKRLKKEKETALLLSRIKEKDAEFQITINKLELDSMHSYLNGLETERERLAKELHDNVANELFGIDMQLKATNCIPEKITIQLENLHSEIRNISHELMPPLFKYASLPEIISDYVSKLEERNNIQIEVDIENEHILESIPDKYSLEIYRIIQEATSNIFKHSEATLAKISLKCIDSVLHLTIEDNGKGFDLSQIHEGIGLHIIRDRTKGLNGKIEINSGYNKGCSLNIHLPIVQ